LSYDPFDNVLVEETGALDPRSGPKVRIVRTYDNNEQSWLLSRLRSEQSTWTDEKRTQQTRAVEYTYDSKGSLQTQRTAAGTDLELVTTLGRNDFGLVTKMV
jgi:YD repeat-containing protein